VSTQINVTVGSGGLSDKAKQLQAAARQAQLEKERTAQIEADGTEQRNAKLAAEGKAPDGSSLYGVASQLPVIERRPAANRLGTRGLFGYLPAGGNNYGYFDAFTEEAYISPITAIRYSSRNYGVIKLGNPNTCSVGNDPASYLFANRAAELVTFVRAGGVLWIQNEWQFEDGRPGCGIVPSVINPYIQDLFNCSIQFGLGRYAGYNIVMLPAYGQTDANFLAYQKEGFTAPDFFYTDVVSPIENGTVMYSHPTVGAVVSFEKIGRGFIVLSADSNDTANFPIGIFEGQQYTFIDALRTLR
jgi:hypothetical protein